jgi:uncharacterized protein YjbI with pentapeptide repeats
MISAHGCHRLVHQPSSSISGTKELLAVLVDGALDHAHDAAQRVVVAVMGAGEAHVEDGHALARTQLFPLGVRFGIGEPLRGAFLTRVPLDDVVRRRALAVLLVVRGDHGDVLDGIVAAVQAQQQSAIGQGARPGQDPLQQRRGGALRVLLALAQLQLQAPTLLSKIRGHGREAIVTLVGVGDALLARAAVVQRRGVRIERHHAVGQGRHGCTHVGQECERCVDNRAAVGVCICVHALAQNPFGGNLLHTQRLVKEHVLAKAGDRLEIRLAQTDQRDVAGEHVAMRHRVAAQRRHRRSVIRKIGVALQRQANEPKSGLGGEIRLGFGNDELAQRPTCWVMTRMLGLYRYIPVSARLFGEIAPLISRIQASTLDEYIVAFLDREAARHDIETCRRWQHTLCRLIESTVSDAQPMEELALTSFREMERQASNADEALLFLHAACADRTNASEPLRWPGRAAPWAWLNRLRGRRDAVKEAFLGLALRRLHLADVDFAGRDLSWTDLRGTELSGANLRSVNLVGVVLVDATLTNADLSEANLTKCNLSRSKMKGTKLMGTNLAKAKLTEAVLAEADLREAHLTACDLRLADLGSADLSGASLSAANLAGALLIGANLCKVDASRSCIADANLSHAKLIEANLREADLHRADLTNADLHRADLQGARLTEAKLLEANLSEANLHQADLRSANLDGSNLKDTKMTRACLNTTDMPKMDLKGVDLSEADLRKADLRGANLRRAVMYQAKLSSAMLAKADLRAANLRGADLTEADLRGADLREADLCKADLSGANLQKAVLSETDLREARLCKADLTEADLCGAELIAADLSEAIVSMAKLHKADLSGADITKIKLTKADLCGADLRGAKPREDLIALAQQDPSAFQGALFDTID